MSRIEQAMEKAARLRQISQEPTPAAPWSPGMHIAEPPLLAPEQVLSPRHPFLITLLDPHSQAAEEYRKLKVMLVKLAKGGKVFKNTIMVTSASAREGKSLTAANLALTLAQELDHTVLLVDAALRRPTLHDFLEIPQGPGLSDLLLGEAGISQTLIPTGLGKLSVIRAGKPVDNPAELFSSQRMKGLVTEIKHRYPDRFLIFDAPPLLPFAETRSLAHLMDGILFVVMEGVAQRAQVKEALESLNGCEIFGVVYNGATAVSEAGFPSPGLRAAWPWKKAKNR